jgi:hypothetical protein
MRQIVRVSDGYPCGKGLDRCLLRCSFAFLQCGKPLFEGPDFIGHRIKMTQAGEISQPVAVFEEGHGAAVGASALAIDLVTSVPAETLTSSAICQVAEDDRAAADGTARADHRAAGNADATRHGRVGADPHVVTNLDLVVQLDAIADDVSPSAPRSIVVPAPISTSSPIRTRPVCGILTQAAIGFAGKTEAVGTRSPRRMNQAALADPAVRHTRRHCEPGVPAPIAAPCLCCSSRPSRPCRRPRRPARPRRSDLCWRSRQHVALHHRARMHARRRHRRRD